MVVWIIGLSGAGKTTLANDILLKTRKEKNNVVLIDGDIIRETFDNDLGFSLIDRKKNADRISQLCKFLDEQGIHVVCAILSLFPESRIWNRKNIKNYFEVYIDAPIKQLQERDYKGLYKKYSDGEINNVAGMDIEFIEPDSSDIIIKNDGSKKDLLEHSEFISKIINNSCP